MSYFINEEIENILNMDYNPKYEYKNEDYLCNDIFNFHYNNLDILKNEINEWRYVKDKFTWGRENKKIFPSLMIYLILSTFKYKRIISSAQYEEVVLGNYKVCGSPLPFTDKQILIGRSYQTYASYLREIDVILKLIALYPDIKIYKNPYLDICGSIDFKLVNNNVMKYIAVKHEGRTTEKYDRLWKNKKEDLSDKEIIRLIAKHNKGYMIEMVDIKDLKNLF